MPYPHIHPQEHILRLKFITLEVTGELSKTIRELRKLAEELKPPDAGRVVAIFREAIERSLREWTPSIVRTVLELVEETVRAVEGGLLTPEQAYYTLLGVADYFIVPLKPRDYSELARALGACLAKVP